MTRLPSTAINVYGSIDWTSIFLRVSVVANSRPPFPHGDHWKTRGLPLRQSIFEPSGMKPSLLENTNGLMGKSAVGAAAVGHHFFVAGQADKADLTQNLQVLTGICDGKSSLSRQTLHGTLAIGKDVDDLEPPAVRQRLCEASELVKEGGLGYATIGVARALAWLRHVQLLGR